MNIVVNGKVCTVADDEAMLIDVVRNGGLTGTKLVCGGPSAAWLGAYATAPGRFFGHTADTKSQPRRQVALAITSA